MRNFGKLISLLGLLLLLGACGTDPDAIRSVDANASLAVSTLTPGESVAINQDLSVNVVFVGFEPGAETMDVDLEAFEAVLPDSYRPQLRVKRFYDLASDMGLQFDFDYNFVFAESDFEDAFFGYLGGLAVEQPPTLFQQLYSAQSDAELAITDNHWIDATTVEQWLADNAGAALGVDTSQYTVFYINWYGRDDFVFHVYTKTDEPDPDTGYNFGLLRDSRKVTGWGGTTPDDEESGLGSLHRIWFYDLSAGPEGWTDNWNVDDADGYTIPPIWEYGTDGYRPFDNLSYDLGLVTRYVAIDLLFTTSPLYSPAISGPLLPDDIQVDANVFDFDDEPVAIESLFDEDLIAAELGELQPHTSFSVELDVERFDSRVEDVYRCLAADVSCFGNRLFGIAFADPFLFFQDHLMQYLDGDGDYEVPVFAFNATDELFTCCLGYADDNWADGTQSFVFAFDAPFIRAAGYGFTTTTIHEVGHHLALSHPHDGYDYEDDLDFGPGGATQFAWLGDFSNSMMSYIDLNWDFSQFDRDNMARYQVAAYLNQANHILAKIAKSKKAAAVEGLVAEADEAAALALVAYQAMDYQDASMYAKSAFDTVVEAAGRINIKLEPQAWQADYKAKGKSDKFVDAFDPNDNRFKP